MAAGAVEDICESAAEAMESTRLRRAGGGSLSWNRSLLLPLPEPLETVPLGVAALLLLPWLLL